MPSITPRGEFGHGAASATGVRTLRLTRETGKNAGVGQFEATLTTPPAGPGKD